MATGGAGEEVRARPRPPLGRTGAGPLRPTWGGTCALQSNVQSSDTRRVCMPSDTRRVCMPTATDRVGPATRGAAQLQACHGPLFSPDEVSLQPGAGALGPHAAHAAAQRQNECRPGAAAGETGLHLRGSLPVGTGRAPLYSLLPVAPPSSPPPRVIPRSVCTGAHSPLCS